MTPQRIQLRRTKGWRKPEGAVVVSRPSRWGNPWVIEEFEGRWYVRPRITDQRPGHGYFGRHRLEARARARAAELYGHWLSGEWMISGTSEMGLVRAEILRTLPTLRGRDLACWCPLDQPCHADVLLELANGGAS